MQLKMALLAALFTAPLLNGCVTINAASDVVATAGTGAPVGPVGLSREAPILNLEGAEVGRAVLTEGPTGVLVQLNLQNGALTPGWHGTHFHQVGACADGGSGYQASGPHVRHDLTATHGLLAPQGPESGDLPSLFAPTSGAFGAEFFTTFVTLAPHPIGDRTPLADADGSALVIHANADDHRSQPIGGAGLRVACAAFSAGN